MAAPFNPTVEQAPMLQVYGGLAGRISALMHCNPALMPRLIFAPRPAMHALAAFLYLSEDAELPDEQLANIVAQTPPRQLLERAIPDPPARLYRALERAGAEAQNEAFYLRLASLCRTPLADTVLGKENLDDACLLWAEALLMLDPSVAALHAILPVSKRLAMHINSLVIYLRDHGEQVDSSLAIPPGAKMTSVHKRLQSAIDRVEAPAAPVALPLPWRVLATIGDLRKVGRKLGNCMYSAGSFQTDSWFRLADGTMIFVTSDDAALLAAFRRVSFNLWVLEEIKGVRNEAVSDELHQALVRAVRGAGLHLVEHTPSSALSSLYHSIPRRTEADDGGGVDEDADLDEAADAA